MENQVLEVPYHMVHGYGGGDGVCFLPGEDHATAVVSPSNLPWFLLPSFHSTNPAASLHQDQELIICPNPLPPLVPPLYGAGAMYSNPSPAGLMESAGGSALMRLNGFLRGTDQGSASSSLFGTIHSELGKLTAQESMDADAKALAASKNHNEAERRRRERINGHLAKLRSMLPNTTKTDKASLLAEVIQHVKELKRQTSEIAEECPLPTEADEIAVESACDKERNFVARASLCCDDRPDLLPDLIGALKALRLRVLKAEIATVGCRVKNALLISHADEQDNGSDDIDAIDPDGEHKQQLIAAVQDALKAVLEQAAKHDDSSGGTKRQRTAGLSAAGMIEHSSNV